MGKLMDVIKQFWNPDPIEEITEKNIVHTIQDAEPIGPKKLTDIMVIAPCSRKYFI